MAVHVYGSIRRVLDIFESYLGRATPWQFRESHERLEIIPMIDWGDAQSGYGYMELIAAKGRLDALGADGHHYMGRTRQHPVHVFDAA